MWGFWFQKPEVGSCQKAETGAESAKKPADELGVQRLISCHFCWWFRNPAHHLGCPKCWFYTTIKTFWGHPEWCRIFSITSSMFCFITKFPNLDFNQLSVPNFHFCNISVPNFQIVLFSFLSQYVNFSDVRTWFEMHFPPPFGNTWNTSHVLGKLQTWRKRW